MRDVVVRPEAEADIREAEEWYTQISPRLGAQFLAALGKAIGLAREYPTAFATAHKSLRRGLLPQFPYALFYRVEAERIVIFGVLHQSRDPEVIKRRF